MHYVEMAQKITAWEGAIFGHFRQVGLPLTPSLVELHIQIVPQKTTFFIQKYF